MLSPKDLSDNQYRDRCSSLFSLGKEEKCHIIMKGNSVNLKKVNLSINIHEMQFPTDIVEVAVTHPAQ